MCKGNRLFVWKKPWASLLMKIKFVEHAKERMKERGASEEEVKEVL